MNIKSNEGNMSLLSLVLPGWGLVGMVRASLRRHRETGYISPLLLVNTNQVLENIVFNRGFNHIV